MSTDALPDHRPTVDEFFDPHNHEHLKALRTLEQTGVWPREFWDAAAEAHVTFPPLWRWSISQKLADAYLKEKLGNGAHQGE